MQVDTASDAKQLMLSELPMTCPRCSQKCRQRDFVLTSRGQAWYGFGNRLVEVAMRWMEFTTIPVGALPMRPCIPQKQGILEEQCTMFSYFEIPYGYAWWLFQGSRLEVRMRMCACACACERV